MRHRIFKFTALIIALAVSLTCAGCFGSSGGGSYNGSYSEPVTNDLYDFSLDTQRIAADTETPVCAYIYAPEATGSVELWDDSAYITDMYDDGVGADEVAGDGIYSTCITVLTDPEDAGSTIYLHVKAGSAQSAPIGIDILGLPTAAQAKEAGDILTELTSIAYSNVDNPSLQLEKAISLADSLHSEGIISEYYVSDNTIGLVHSSGMHINFMPYIPNTLAVGDGSSVTVSTMDSYSDSPEFLYDICAFSDGHRLIYAYENTYLAANNVANAFPNYIRPDSADLDVSEVTPDAIASCLGPDMLVLWQGHGGFDKDLGPFLGTGETYDANRYSTDPAYFGKFLSNEYISLSDGRIGITGKFIRLNVRDLSGSVIFLNACLSGMDSRLADAFLSKGAQIVAAYTHSVYIPYASAMQYTVITKMTEINGNTGDYYTMQEALDFAQYNYGYTDLDRHQTQPGKVAASVITFGKAPSEIRLASVNGSYAPPAETPAPTVAPPVAPQEYSNYDAHQAYKRMLQNYTWVDSVPSDLSEIPPSEYADYWMGSYYVIDIDNNGIDELVIKCGQSIADMSMTVFTFADGKIICTGYVRSGDAWLMDMRSGTGAIVVEHHGGSGYDTYIDLNTFNLAITRTEEYNYEQAGYTDPKESIAYYLDSYNVSDLSGL